MIAIAQVATPVDARVRFELAEVVRATVHNNACMGFMLPFATEDALAYWDKIFTQVAAGGRILFTASVDGRVVGTIQLVIDMPANQVHRADVAKLMVHPQYRRRGIAGKLLDEMEQTALHLNRRLLVLDTVTGGPAEGMYQALGWQRVGEIPEYSAYPSGGLVPTTIFYKLLR